MCPEDLKKNSDFDTEFYAYGLLNDRLYFRGIRASHIFLDPFDGRWTLQSLKNPGKISKLVKKHALKKLDQFELRAKSFTSFISDLRQDINRGCSFSRCLIGIFP